MVRGGIVERSARVYVRASMHPKPVPDAAYGLQSLGFRSELAPQRSHSSLDDVAALVVGVPDGAQDLLAAGHRAAARDQELHQRQFDRRERDPAAVDDQLARLSVQQLVV